jgi:hypothetical protein
VSAPDEHATSARFCRSIPQDDQYLIALGQGARIGPRSSTSKGGVPGKTWTKQERGSKVAGVPTRGASPAAVAQLTPAANAKMMIKPVRTCVRAPSICTGTSNHDTKDAADSPEPTIAPRGAECPTTIFAPFEPVGRQLWVAR